MNLNKIINNILNETIEKFILNESLSSKVYHFCNIDAFWGICKYNSFILTSSNTNKSDDRMSKIGRTQISFLYVF